MNAFEMNKIVGAVLGTLLLVMGVGFLADEIYAPIEGRGVGYALPEANANEGHEEVAEVVEVVSLEVLLASASADDGARVSRKCQSCHNFGEGEGNKVGPVLYGIVGSLIASNDSFSYSDSMAGKNAAGETWTYEALNQFLTAPKEFAPDTKMSFSGLRKDQDRVDLMAYLQTLSANPVAFPMVEGGDAAMEETPTIAEEAAPMAEAAVEEVTPVTEETVVVEEAAPVVEETTPVVEEAAPVEETAPVVQEEASAVVETAPAVVEDTSFAALLAGADLTKGARVARKCKACHGFDAGDGNKVGPPLYNIVGRVMGTAEDFRYSDGLKSMGADGGIWTYENLNSFVIKPRDFVDGTKMSFSGLRKEEDRINLMAYLQSLSDNPVAFPE